MPYMNRPKRSDSAAFDAAGPRGLFDSTARLQEISEEPTFIPTSLGEHLLERTYLDDVVRPLVRALVKARMTYGANGEAAEESSQAYVDLEKLRRELERSTQRARHAEQERDDLARRLDLAGIPDASRERAERHAELMVPGEHASASSRNQPQPPPNMLGMKRPRPSEAELMRSNYDQRLSAPGSNAVSVSVAHGDGPGASVTVTTDGHPGAPLHMTSRPHHGPGPEPMSPPMSYAHPGTGAGAGPRHRPYPDMHHDAHDPERGHLSRMPLSEAEYAYADDRADRYALPPGPSGHRPPLPRYSAMGPRSPPGSSAYLTSGSERSSMPTLTTYPSTSSSSSFSATPYSSVHPYDHEMEEVERSRKMARPLDHHSMTPGGRPLGPNNYAITPSADVNYPVRKLASTKNRTCSNCAAPHDAKFRRGPNGPGTLCDRCGSRWKKFKEQESANKREQDTASHNGGGGGSNNNNNNGPASSTAAAAAAAATASAQARLSSASASSLSPMDPANNAQGESARTSESDSIGRREGGSASALVSPRDGPASEDVNQTHSQMQQRGSGERERSASVDQLIDD